MSDIKDDDGAIAEEAERQEKALANAARYCMATPVDPRTVDIQPLAGMTNRNYLATVNGERFVVRIPGAGTEEYIDRAADEEAGRLTSDIGVNAPLVWYNPKTGEQITRFVEGCVTMSPEPTYTFIYIKREHECYMII